jgi:predicted nucleic acid-binding protein
VTILVDTNLLCRLCNSIKPPTLDALAARKSLQLLRDRGHSFAIAPQNLYEFWAVATRSPSANGLGMSVDRADAWLAYVLRNFKVLGESDQSFATWRGLVITHQVTGYKSHDVRLVAAMQTHGLTDILTFNINDFKRFPGITILDPKTII